MKQKENVKEEVKEEAGEKQQKNNFAQGSIVVNILKLAVPMTLAQLINVLYNIDQLCQCHKIGRAHV